MHNLSPTIALVNASPRGINSNTLVLFEAFCKGLKKAGREYVIFHLQKSSHRQTLLSTITDYAFVLWGFPMYTDAMPGTVKAFFEDLAEKYPDNAGQTFGFIVQMGFPEASQADVLVQYLSWYCKHRQVAYAGTIVRGGVEGIRIQPRWMVKKLLRLLEQAGYHLGDTNELNPALLSAIAKPYKLKRGIRIVLRMMKALGMMNFYWDNQLKENHAFAERFATPYLPKTGSR